MPIAKDSKHIIPHILPCRREHPAKTRIRMTKRIVNNGVDGGGLARDAGWRAWLRGPLTGGPEEVLVF